MCIRDRLLPAPLVARPSAASASTVVSFASTIGEKWSHGGAPVEQENLAGTILIIFVGWSRSLVGARNNRARHFNWRIGIGIGIGSLIFAALLLRTRS